MALSSTIFELFTSASENSELVSQNKFGIHEVSSDGTIVTKEITEADFSKYDVNVSVEFGVDPVHTLNSQYTNYPFVSLTTE